jgi:hypothetical protein
MPIAPTMRCRMPPDIWCGYSRTRVSGAVIRTDFSSAVALAHAGLRGMCSCTRSGSATWSPIVNSGFNDAIGSCRIIAIFLPRMWRISSGDFASRSSPSNSILPPAFFAAVGSSRRIDSASVVLPDPDSPTTPSVSPRSSAMVTLSTAFTTRLPPWLT